MVYISAVLRDGSKVRLHAPGYESGEDAVADFVTRQGVYSQDWLRLDARGKPRYVRFDQVVDVRPADGASLID